MKSLQRGNADASIVADAGVLAPDVDAAVEAPELFPEGPLSAKLVGHWVNDDVRCSRSVAARRTAVPCTTVGDSTTAARHRIRAWTRRVSLQEAAKIRLSSFLGLASASCIRRSTPGLETLATANKAQRSMGASHEPTAMRQPLHTAMPTQLSPHQLTVVR
jgi:hypothetical protein